MKLNKLLENIDVKLINPAVDLFAIEVNNIICDSRRVREGDLFIAVRGEIYDGHDFIAEAISRGARVILTEESFSDKRVLSLIAGDTRQARSILADNYYSHPARDIKLIGITGTNGKTTTTYLVSSILNAAGKSTGIIGTINYHLGERLIPSVNTTPGTIDLRRYLSEMRSTEIQYAVIEVSSHALEQRRLEGLKFSRAIFTNLTQDHLDYHQTMDGYFQAKARLFKKLDKEAVAILNLDDEFSRRLADLTEAEVLSYGREDEADVSAERIVLSDRSTAFKIRFPDGKIDIKSALLGGHNIYNIMAAASCGYSLGINKDKIKEGIESLLHVPGRLESVECGQDFRVFVDYAHTENALFNILNSVRNFHSGKLTLVFGCGGDRDRTKRPRMGKVASDFCHRLIITSDNPRSENPHTIAEEIVSGINPEATCHIILDRFQAIEKALGSAEPGEVVIIAGKGHETYQVLRNSVVPFDDREVCREILNAKI